MVPPALDDDDDDSLNPPNSMALNTGEARANAREQTTNRTGFTLAVPTARCRSPSGSKTIGDAGRPSSSLMSPIKSGVDFDLLPLVGRPDLTVFTELVDLVRTAGNAAMLTTDRPFLGTGW